MTTGTTLYRGVWLAGLGGVLTTTAFMWKDGEVFDVWPLGILAVAWATLPFLLLMLYARTCRISRFALGALFLATLVLAGLGALRYWHAFAGHTAAEQEDIFLIVPMHQLCGSFVFLAAAMILRGISEAKLAPRPTRSTPIPWEEDPAYQRAQATLILGALSVATVIAIIYAACTGEMDFIGMCIGAWVGIFLAWAILGGAMIVIAACLTRWKRNP
jgi:hypothetical protein